MNVHLCENFFDPFHRLLLSVVVALLGSEPVRPGDEVDLEVWPETPHQSRSLPHRVLLRRSLQISLRLIAIMAPWLCLSVSAFADLVRPQQIKADLCCDCCVL